MAKSRLLSRACTGVRPLFPPSYHLYHRPPTARRNLPRLPLPSSSPRPLPRRKLAFARERDSMKRGQPPRAPDGDGKGARERVARMRPGYTRRGVCGGYPARSVVADGAGGQRLSSREVVDTRRVFRRTSSAFGSTYLCALLSSPPPCTPPCPGSAPI